MNMVFRGGTGLLEALCERLCSVVAASHMHIITASCEHSVVSLHVVNLPRRHLFHVFEER